MSYQTKMARRGFRMTLKSAKELLENPNNCVEKITSERRFPLLISFVNKVRNGVSKQLIGETGRYSSKLEGIVLATDNIKIINPLANSIDDLPYLIVDISVDFIVFKPSIGCSMAGTVTKTGVYYISCLVHGCFNVSIKRTEETELFQQVKVGDSVVLEVVSFQYQGHNVNIQGKLIHLIEKEITKDQTKAVEEKNGEHTFDIKCVKKEIETTEEEDDATINETEIEIKKKKNLKRKKANLNGLELPKDNSSIKMESDSESTTRKHKKKKRERDYNNEEKALDSQLEDDLRDEKSNSESEVDEKTKRKLKKKKKKDKSFSEEEKPLDEVEKIKKSKKGKTAELNETANGNNTTDYENSSQIAEEENDELGREKKKKKSKKHKKIKAEIDSD